jgi:hypothetical protein
MVTTKKELAVLMAATMIAVGLSIAPFIGAEAGPISTSRSNIKALTAQQEGEQTCINQVDGQGDKQAIANPDQTQASDQGDAQATFNAYQSRSGDFTQGDTDITVNSDPSNNCSQELNLTAVDNGDVSDSDLTDTSTNEAVQ